MRRCPRSLQDNHPSTTGSIVQIVEHCLKEESASSFARSVDSTIPAASLDATKESTVTPPWREIFPQFYPSYSLRIISIA